ncbi:MAG: hypothetical protein ACRC3B_11725, partial [Bacteroidia bacterium]
YYEELMRSGSEMLENDSNEESQVLDMERTKLMEFTDASTGDILMFTDEKYATVAAQVYEATADEYLLLIPYPELSGHKITDAGLTDYFYDSTTAVRKVRISKETIRRTVDTSDGTQVFKGAEITEFSHLTKFPLTAWKVEHPTVVIDSNQ